MSGIRDRIDGALILWECGRYDGAFLNCLIAVAATARLRYPKFRDREAFESFLLDNQTPIRSVEYKGECRPLESIFYKWLRCQLVHEAEIPPDIQFVEDHEPDTMSIRAGGAPEYILKLSYGWFEYTVGIVMNAPENDAIFSQMKEKPIKGSNGCTGTSR